MFGLRRFVIFLVLLVVLGAFNHGFAQHSPVFPQPQSYQLNADKYVHQGVLNLPKGSLSQELIGVFQPQFSQLYGIDLKESDTPGILFIKLNDRLSGYYELEITDAQITVSFSDYKSAVFAMQSLLQLTNSQFVLGMKMRDYPVFGYRGVHLDCARHFFTIDEIKHFIDEIARLKFNTFHWHLTDDQGWRIEIKKYPKLTTVGAWRDSTLVGHFSEEPDVYKKQRYGGYYTQEEAKAIVVYAKARGIDVIPEIELPGHARAALAAYPELGCLGNGAELGVSGTWGVFDDVFCTKNETLDFLKDVLAEIVAIFPSKTIHVGGDECPKVRWEKCDKCQNQMKSHGLHNEHELQSFVIGEMARFLASEGRELMGWDEILEGGLAENAKVMSWRGTEGGIAAAKAKHQVVMNPTSHCYFDYYQSGSSGEPLAIGGYLPLDKVYAFDPIPNELTAEEQKFILGGQANLWTEYISDFAGVQYMMFPRLVAMAEVLWTEKSKRPAYNEFVVALNQYQFPYYQQKGINYSKAAFEPHVDWEARELGVRLSVDYPLKEANVGFQRSHDYEMNEFIGLEEYAVYVHRSSNLVLHPYNVNVRIDDKLVSQTPVKVYSHMALGCNVNFETPPSPKYNVHGDLGLVDGVTGSKPWKGHQWLGFEVSTIKFSVSLGRRQSFNKIDLGTLHDPGSWIYRPKQVLIAYSKNGKKWKQAEAVLENDHFILNKRIKARELKFTVINDEKIAPGLIGAGFTPWTFLDELIITK